MKTHGRIEFVAVVSVNDSNINNEHPESKNVEGWNEREATMGQKEAGVGREKLLSRSQDRSSVLRATLTA